MKRILFIVLLLAAVIFFLFSWGFAEDGKDYQVVDSEGTGAILNDDPAKARNTAVRDALNKAVDRVVATLIPSGILAKKAKVIREGINAKRDEYIHDYRILSEKQIQAFYVVNVRTTVYVNGIKGDLQSLGFLKAEKIALPATGIAITVRGIKSCTDYVSVKEILKKKVRGVRNIHQRRFAWGMARLDLDIDGTVQSLRDNLARTGYFSLDVSRRDQSHIEATYLK